MKCGTCLSLTIEGVDLCMKWRWLGYRGWDIKYDECRRNWDREENLDEQSRIFLIERRMLEDDRSGQPNHETGRHAEHTYPGMGRPEMKREPARESHPNVQAQGLPYLILPTATCC
jgi:hypothetical protein